MSLNKHISFLLGEVKKKPNSIIHKDTLCPFCGTLNESEILDSLGTIVLLKNKYPTIKNSVQTVLVETDKCGEDISTYSPEHLQKLISFGFNHWNKMKASGEFKSVIFYKNHGMYSGGSISHSHMQIVGLRDASYETEISSSHFEGFTVHESEFCQLNISEFPRVGATEFNIILSQKSDFSQFTSFIQKTVHFILNHFHGGHHSFNLFFYDFDGKIICKAIPRFITSPLFIGYSLASTTDQLQMLVKKMKEIYF